MAAKKKKPINVSSEAIVVTAVKPKQSKEIHILMEHGSNYDKPVLVFKSKAKALEAVKTFSLKKLVGNHFSMESLRCLTSKPNVTNITVEDLEFKKEGNTVKPGDFIYIIPPGIAKVKLDKIYSFLNKLNFYSVVSLPQS